MSLNGIDISMHQAGINLSAVKSDFVIVKATEGTGYTDPQFTNLITQAINAGKKIGIYHFCRNDLANTAIAEADWFLSVIKNYIGKAILVLDWESSKSGDVAYAKAFLDRVKEKTGYNPMIYMNQSTENSYDWSSVANANYGLWGAKYRDNNPDYNYDMSNAGTPFSSKYWKVIAMWQWTSTGRLDGYGSNLDCNIFYGDASAWDKYAGGGIPTPAPKPDPTPTPTPTPSTKYKEGTPFYCTGLWTSSTGGQWIPASGLKYGKGIYTVGNIYKGTAHPYVAMKDGTIIGFANDKCIDDEPLIPGKETSKPVVQTIRDGSRVRVKNGATDYNGGGLASFVYNTTYTVMSHSNDRYVIGIGGQVTAAVKLKDLYLA